MQGDIVFKLHYNNHKETTRKMDLIGGIHPEQLDVAVILTAFLNIVLPPLTT